MSRGLYWRSVGPIISTPPSSKHSEAEDLYWRMLDMIDGAPVLAAIFGLCSNRWKVDVVLHRILDGLRDKGMVKGATEEEEERDGTVSRARGKRASAVGREGKMQTRKKVSSKRKGKQGDSDSEGAEEQDDGVRPKVRWLGSAAE